MFDFSLGELLLLAVIGVVFIGKEELPVVVRAIAKVVAFCKAMSREVRGVVDELARESGVRQAQAEIEREVRLITGDDGKPYEAYDISDLIRGQDAPAPPGSRRPALRGEGSDHSPVEQVPAPRHDGPKS